MLTPNEETSRKFHPARVLKIVWPLRNKFVDAGNMLKKGWHSPADQALRAERAAAKAIDE